MATEVQYNDGWEELLQPRINSLIMKVTTAVRDDARSICPVDTRALKESLTPINYKVGVGRVISHLPYCAAVELGFHGEEFVRTYEIKRGRNAGRVIKAHVRQGNSPEQPYLRPALYKTRDLGDV